MSKEKPVIKSGFVVILHLEMRVYRNTGKL